MKHLFFYNIDIFYYLALDTPLISNTTNNNESIFEPVSTAEISWHTMENKEYWKNYLSSSIITSITLLRHIKTFNKIEIEKIKTDQREFFNLADNFDEFLITGISHKLRSFSEKSKFNYKNLLINLQGIREY